jgi:carbon-monoxide dehydrogenase medium subunit
VAAALRLNPRSGRIEDARVAITAVNPAPHLIKDADAHLIGTIAGEQLAEKVGELAARTAKPLTTSALTPEYRREMVRVFAKRAVMAAAN